MRADAQSTLEHSTSANYFNNKNITVQNNETSGSEDPNILQPLIEKCTNIQNPGNSQSMEIIANVNFSQSGYTTNSTKSA